MSEDVQLALEGSRAIHFHGRVGGMLVSPDEVMEKVERVLAGSAVEVSHG
jgi:2-oxoglutarate ferredoxin oxidoreductase subunit alpha